MRTSPANEADRSRRSSCWRVGGVSLAIAALVGCQAADEAVDAGADAAPPDAAPPDAAPPDAAPPDAAPPDAAPPDAPPPECADDLDCGPHGRCDTTDTWARCACVAGYVRVQEVCEWGTVPRDPGLADPTAWVTRDGAFVDPTAAGTVDPGLAWLPAQAGCTYPEVAQTFPMPARADAEPLWLEIDAETTDDWGLDTYAVLGLDDGWQPLPQASAPAHICLGERAFGDELTLALSMVGLDRRAPGQYPVCTPEASTRLDHVQIVPAPPGACPDEVGVIVDPGLADPGAWETSLSADASVVFQPGGGADDGPIAMLASGTLGRAEIAQLLSMPAAAGLPWPAIEVRYRSAVDGPESMGGSAMAFGPHTWRLPATGGELVQERLCIPPDQAGLVDRLVFSSEGFRATLRLDQLALVSEPACGDGAVLDPGFEAAAAGVARGPWRLQTYDEGELPAAIVDPVAAHGGAAFLQLRADSNCDVTVANVTAVAPRGAAGGPVVHFWYRSTDTRDQVHSPAGELAPAAEWTFMSHCIGGGSGRPIDLRFRLGAWTPMLCSQTYPVVTLDLDDVELLLDPACPL